MKSSLYFTAALIAALSVNTAAAEPLKVGDTLPKLTLTDQFDKAGIVPSNTKIVVFMADRTAGQMIVDYLDSKNPAWLTPKHVVVLSDIHNMPAMMKLFAFPQLRSKYYPMILGREEADLAMFPHQKTCATVLTIQTSNISAIQYACNEKELASQMDAIK
ncbi:MAG: hypothetical protein HOP20_11315 [Sulfuriferula sp.]|nr:hypothetical protein [Sulfuriferula sp.]